MRGKSVAVLLGACTLASGLDAATITVGNTNDSGPGSLRDALAIASRGDDIVFDPTLALQPILLTSGELFIEKDVAITGLGRGQTVLDGNGADRVLRIADGVVVSLTGLTARNGFPQQVVPGEYGDEIVSEGGGIYNAGTLILNDASIEGNRVSSRTCENGCVWWPVGSVRGGGVFNHGTLRMYGGAINDNRADYEDYQIEGGGIYNSGHATIVGTIISGNDGANDRGAGVQGAGAFNSPDGFVVLHQVQVVGNRANAAPAIVNRGALLLEQSTVAGNGIWIGGGILNFGTATLIDSVIAGNSSGAGGLQRDIAGGITNKGFLALERSTVFSNSGEGNAGIANFGGALRAANSTIARNDAYMGIGGIHNTLGGGTILNGTTIAGNGRGGLANGSSASVQGTLIAGNWEGDPRDPQPADCWGTLDSLGHNLLGDGAGCAGVLNGVAGDLVGVDWKIVLESTAGYYDTDMVVARNGGATPTAALLPGSPAIDAVPEDACRDADGNPLTTDQRGVARPQGAACDIGAFEFSPPRGTGFWSHQCGDSSYHQLPGEQMQTLFEQVAADSPAFPECAPVDCDALRPDPPENDMRAKTGRHLLGTWLNLITGRVTRGRPIDLLALTQAATAGDALAEIERTVCDPDAHHGELAIARDLAEAINNQGEDMELVSVELSVTAPPGSGRSFALALINMSPDVRSYDLIAEGTWPVSLSPARVSGLGPGQISMVSATVIIPIDNIASAGEVRITAIDRDSEASLARTAAVPILVGDPGHTSGSKNRPRR